MVLQPKRDASHASIRLTRNIKGHLLSNFNKDKRPTSMKPEPATDDEPISSSEEDTLSNAGLDEESEEETRPRVSRPTLDEKLAKRSQDEEQTPRARRQRNDTKDSRTSTPATSRKRASQEMTDDPLFSAYRELDSGHKRRRQTIAYPSRKSLTTSSALTSPKSESPAGIIEGKKQKNTKDGGKKKGPKKEFKVPRDIKDESPKPQFKQPPPMPNDMISSSSLATSSALDALIFDDDDSSIGTPLSTASSSLMNELSEAMLDETVLTEPSVCPWCKAPVDPGMLLRFRAQPKQRMREQQRFCESHKQSTAEQEWKEKGYPTIDWDTFDERINRHFADLETIMVPESTSFYRNILDTTLKTGKAKNFRLTLAGDGLEAMSCGYYGTRGAGKMLQAITTRYGRRLRRLAVSDHIVKTAGVVPYAQAVLVPELAVRLVKEDLGVPDETARQILRETMDLGEKLNFALNDKVPVPEEKLQ
ncbi:hypothetical protein BO94DRAFT_482040 [Aspergillus sclerotioniger CBS 115572]|uniref:Restriction of telomere capping protein 4 n=1 Tax=Aspergillus sclerotioniger CBS 115572 TaxID=1450535 RepID=A0A317XEU5_9EURO|nr:hypothetical protein BO94DRAFT_482040 [Aspergillus sclerotioniger CBS 115572]PWY95498.1 hypothetical protein BO94DRAFT_482040 [Aspergillus sclerotioniger CBS 115572]